MTILCSQKERKQSTVIRKLNQATVLLVTVYNSIQNVKNLRREERTHPWGDPVQVTAHAADMLTNTC